MLPNPKILKRPATASAAILALVAMSPGAGAGEYDPSPEYPFGRPHPEAAPELSDFAFAIGTWACRSRRPQADGTMSESLMDWRFEYGLNGRTVHDYFEDEVIRGFGVRLFDPTKGEWQVTTTSAWPNAFSATWSGGRQGQDRVLDLTFKGQEGEDILSRLTFYAIEDDSFEWKMERVGSEASQLRWHIACDRTN